MFAVKKKRFSVEQVVGVLKQAEVGVPIGELVRQGGRPNYAAAGKFLQVFQSTPPEGGRPEVCLYCGRLLPFQSTPPQGGRPLR